MSGASVTGPDEKYLTDEYVDKNPTWDMEDSPWKASLVARVLRKNSLSPTSICEIGCGAGLVMAELRKSYPSAELFGFDIAPAASRFWPRHESADIHFAVGDFATLNRRTYDAILILDVIEHVRDPFAFLSGLRGAARYFVLIIPLDLSALSVAREQPLLTQRRNVGHIHFFTKNLALAMLEENGFRVIDQQYSGAAFNAPRRTWKTTLAMAPRWIARQVNRDWAVRVLGGETLVVLADAQEPAGAGEKLRSAQ
jgi:cyclopropane fatty-acyl-phospholipid synthase-like methyltransferase